MTHSTTPRMRRSRTLAALVMSASLLAAACGSDAEEPKASDTTEAGSTGGADVETSLANLTAAEAEQEFPAPGSAFEVVDGLDGKMIFAVLNDVTAPFTQSLIAGMEEAAAEFGMTIETVDGKRSAANAAAEIEKAVARKPAAIIVGAFQSEALSAALGEAKKAGIPVIEQANREGGTLPNEVRELGIAASVGFCYSCAGELLADSIIVDSGAKATVAVININDVPVSNLVANSIKARMDELCEACSVQIIDTPAATTSPTTINGLTSAFVSKNDGDVYMVATFDYYVPQIASALAGTGAEGRTKLLGWNATHSALQMLQEGDSVLADMGADPGLMGWATIDAALRVLSGEEPVEDPKIPVRAFTKNNIADVDLDAAESEWYGGGYADMYRSLWGKG